MIANANVIAVGWRLCIPAAGAATPAAQPTSPLPTPAAAPVASNATNADAANADAANTDDGISALDALDARIGPDGVFPLTIEYLREQEYPGSPIVVEQTLDAGSRRSTRGAITAGRWFPISPKG